MNILEPGSIVKVRPEIVAVGLQGSHFWLQQADLDGVVMYDTEVIAELDEDGNFQAKVIGVREE